MGSRAEAPRRANQHIHVHPLPPGRRRGWKTSHVAGQAAPSRGERGDAAPKVPRKGPVDFQAWLEFTSGAATLSLLILHSSETKARDALPWAVVVFPQLEPHLSRGEQPLLGTSQPPHEYSSWTQRGKPQGRDGYDLAGLGRAPTELHRGLLQASHPRGGQLGSRSSQRVPSPSSCGWRSKGCSSSPPNPLGIPAHP